MTYSRGGPEVREAACSRISIPLENVDWAPREEVQQDGVIGAHVSRGFGLTVKSIEEYGGHASGHRDMLLVGWPVRCLTRTERNYACGLWYDYTDRELSPWERGIIVWPPSAMRLTAPVRKDLVPEQRLALRPVWLGILADGAVFGGLMWFIARFVGTMRASMRARSSRRAGCGYDLTGLRGGSACPECERNA
jgi:hypothetical protein